MNERTECSGRTALLRRLSATGSLMAVDGRRGSAAGAAAPAHHHDGYPARRGAHALRAPVQRVSLPRTIYVVDTGTISPGRHNLTNGTIAGQILDTGTNLRGAASRIDADSEVR